MGIGLNFQLQTYKKAIIRSEFSCDSLFSLTVNDERPTMNDELALLKGKPEGDAIRFVADAVLFAVEFH